MSGFPNDTRTPVDELHPSVTCRPVPLLSRAWQAMVLGQSGMVRADYLSTHYSVLTTYSHGQRTYSPHELAP